MDSDTKAVLEAAKRVNPKKRLRSNIAAAYAEALRKALGFSEVGHLRARQEPIDLNDCPGDECGNGEKRKNVAHILGHRLIK